MQPAASRDDDDDDDGGGDDDDEMEIQYFWYTYKLKKKCNWLLDTTLASTGHSVAPFLLLHAQFSSLIFLIYCGWILVFAATLLQPQSA